MSASRRWPGRFAALLLFVAPAACGTLATRETRWREEPRSFGWPLFASLPYDVELLAGQRNDCKSLGLEPVGGLLSLPVDLVFELVLLPLDVIAGCCGRTRATPEVVWSADEAP